MLTGVAGVVGVNIACGVGLAAGNGRVRLQPARSSTSKVERMSEIAIFL